MSASLLRDPFTVIDGGLSTALEQLGHHPSGMLWTAALLIDRPDEVTRAHRLYVDAGADVVISASYQASVDGFLAAGLDATAARRALASTTDVARRSGAPLVAASIGPYGAVLGDGSEYHGRYTASWTEVRRFHRERLEVLADSGPDLFAVESIPGRVEAQIVLEELTAVSPLPAWVTFTCRDAVHTCAGDVFADAPVAVAHPQVFAVGVNCTAPHLIAPLLASAPADRPFVAYPNRGGTWDGAAGCWVGAALTSQLADHAAQWLALGARLIGGCCGLGPAAVAALVEYRATLPS